MSIPDITVRAIDPAAAAAIVDSGNALLLDVREDDEWAAGHSPNATTHMPLGRLDPAAIPADTPVIAVCRSGARSSRAAATLAAVGVPVSNLDGGMNAWAAAGLPVVTDSGASGIVA